MDGGLARGGVDLLAAGAQLAVRDVVEDALVEQHHVLRHLPYPRAQAAQAARRTKRASAPCYAPTPPRSKPHWSASQSMPPNTVDQIFNFLRISSGKGISVTQWLGIPVMQHPHYSNFPVGTALKLPRKGRAPVVGDGAPRDAEHACVGLVEAEEQAQDRGLPAAARAHHRA